VFYRSERTNGYWFDYFSIAPDFVDLDNPRANSLSPEGISMYEQKRRTEKLREIEIEKTRQNRSGK
jgi:hypothetical protein